MGECACVCAWLCACEGLRVHLYVPAGMGARARQCAHMSMLDCARACMRACQNADVYMEECECTLMRFDVPFETSEHMHTRVTCTSATAGSAIESFSGGTCSDIPLPLHPTSRSRCTPTSSPY